MNKHRMVEFVSLGFSAWGVVSTTRQIVTSWREEDRLERAASVAGLAASALGLLVSLRRYRRDREAEVEEWSGPVYPDDFREERS